MTTKEIKISIESGRLHLSREEKIEYWANFFFILGPMAFLEFITIYMPELNGDILVTSVILIGLLVLFLRHKITSPKLEVYKSNLTEDQFRQANQAAAQLNDWTVLSNKKGYFSAIKAVGWQWGGIKITAIQNQGRLYINSMVNPSMRSNPFTFGLNKKNKMELIRQYQTALKGNNVVEMADSEIKNREDAFWNEPEWTLKNILIRVIGYGLSAIFLLTCVLLVYEGSWNAIPLSFMCFGIIFIYIRSDVKIIREKNRRKRGLKNRK